MGHLKRCMSSFLFAQFKCLFFLFTGILSLQVNLPYFNHNNPTRWHLISRYSPNLIKINMKSINLSRFQAKARSSEFRNDNTVATNSDNLCFCNNLMLANNC